MKFNMAIFIFSMCSLSAFAATDAYNTYQYAAKKCSGKQINKDLMSCLNKNGFSLAEQNGDVFNGGKFIVRSLDGKDISPNEKEINDNRGIQWSVIDAYRFTKKNVHHIVLTDNGGAELSICISASTGKEVKC